MNMKRLLTYFAILTLSLNVFALEVQNKPNIATSGQTSPFPKIALNQENSPDATLLAAKIVNSHTIPQATAEKSGEFLNALGVYLIIIIVYSIYGFKANARN